MNDAPLGAESGESGIRKKEFVSKYSGKGKCDILRGILNEWWSSGVSNSFVTADSCFSKEISP